MVTRINKKTRHNIYRAALKDLRLAGLCMKIRTAGIEAKAFTCITSAASMEWLFPEFNLFSPRNDYAYWWGEPKIKGQSGRILALALMMEMTKTK